MDQFRVSVRVCNLSPNDSMGLEFPGIRHNCQAALAGNPLADDFRSQTSFLPRFRPTCSGLTTLKGITTVHRQALSRDKTRAFTRKIGHRLGHVGGDALAT